jgi:hypothetical protein
MALDRQRYGFGFFVVTSVIGANNALEFGEFTHHVGEQIRLGKVGSALGE